jgi:hypothetical protein
MAVDGSTTPVDFWYQPAPGDLFRVDVVHLSITDNGAPGYNDYGNVTGPLPNGVRLWTERNGVRLYSDKVYRNNVDVLTVASASEIYTMDPPSRVIIYRAEYAQFSAGPLFSGIDSTDKIGIQIRDDLSTLQLHECTLTGAVFRGSL